MKYSQNNEEQVILGYFRNKKQGTFLDIGANDGITLSNTRALYEKGWSGVFVEASPKAFERLKRNYEFETCNDRVNLINVAVGKHNGFGVLHESGELLKQGDVALVSSMKEEEVRRWDSLNMPFSDVDVEINDFPTLLDRCSIKKFDFLSIDIEGMELDVLPQIDFDKLGIKLACIEWNSKGQSLYDSIMISQGFRIIHRNQENLIYARQ